MGEKQNWHSDVLKAEDQHIEYKLEKSKAVLNLEYLANAYCEISRWVFVILNLVVIFLIFSFITSVVLLIEKQPNRAYGENCRRFECISSLGLVCLNNICTCLPHEHYTNKCVSLSSFGQPCIEAHQCQIELVCRNSACTCTNTQYWNGTSCQNQTEYNNSCIRNEECRSDLNLFCNMNKLLCDCLYPEE